MTTPKRPRLTKLSLPFFDGMAITHKQLVDIGAKWLARKYIGVVVLPEYSRASGETPDVIGFGKRDSYVIECKISRTDFIADKRKQYRTDYRDGMGNYRWYLSPGVISKDEIPEQWGLLEYNNGKVYKVVDAIRFKHSDIRENEYAILQSLARRADMRGLLPQLREEFGIWAKFNTDNLINEPLTASVTHGEGETEVIGGMPLKGNNGLANHAERSGLAVQRGVKNDLS